MPDDPKAVLALNNWLPLQRLPITLVRVWLEAYKMGEKAGCNGLMEAMTYADYQDKEK